MFPILPVPEFLVELAPVLTSSFGAWLGFVVCVAIGLVSMLVGISNHNNGRPRSEVMQSLRAGFGLIGLAGLFLLASPYLWSVLILGVLFYIAYIIIEAITIMIIISEE